MGPTLIGLLQESVVKFASLAALKSRNQDGTFHTLTYAELYQSVREFGTGLISVGLAPGKHVAIIAENNSRWLISDLAVLGCGGVDVPLSGRLSDQELESILSHSDCEMAVVENQTVLSRLLFLRRRLPMLRKVVVFDLVGPKPRGDSEFGRLLIYSWEDILGRGKSRIERGERRFDLRAAGVSSADLATLLYTSGTIGSPKGVMLTHGNIMHNVVSVQANISPAPGTTWLSVLPVWHSFERTVEYCSLSFGGTIAYSQAAEWKIFEDLKTLTPNYLVIVPALLEGVQRSLEKRLGSLESLFVRFEKFYLVFLGFVTGRFPRFRREERVLEVFAAILPLVVLSPVKLLSWLILRRRVRAVTGGSLRAIICGGGPLPAYLDRYFAALGIDILEGYGLTEAAPIVSVRMERSPVLGSAGRPLPSTEVRIIGDNGEPLAPGRKGTVQVRGPQVMQGYYKDPQATRQAVSEDGWLTTGDAGILTLDGNLVITGRTRNALVLRSGERVEPEPIEALLCESPYIQQAVAVGDQRDAVGLLIVPDMEALRGYARTRRISYGDDGDLLCNPAVTAFYQAEVQSRLLAAGVGFPGGKGVKIAVLPARFEVGRELTRTMTKKREVIGEMYGGVIERLYRP
jgi:long-chain acyl-CoA synthetase